MNHGLWLAGLQCQPNRISRGTNTQILYYQVTYVEYLKDSGHLPDLHYQLESSSRFIRLENDNYAAAFHCHKQLPCITFSFIVKFCTTIKLHCKSLASLIKRKYIHLVNSQLRLLHFQLFDWPKKSDYEPVVGVLSHGKQCAKFGSDKRSK